MTLLLEPLALNSHVTFRNRIGMSSLTRNRCVDDNKPGPSQVKYYTDRARGGAALIVTEGTLIDWAGCPWPYAPFMINDEHCKAWRAVTDAVHEEGALIYMQAWHMGRCQNENMPIMKRAGAQVLAPSAIQAEGGKYHDLPGQPGHSNDVKSIVNPRDIVELYRRSAVLAKKAGFDGIELLAQGGYLPHQFLMSRANKRTDSFGGSIANRCRFTLETFDAISSVFDGPQRICIKINPTDILNDSVVSFDEMQQTYTYLIKELVARDAGIINLGRRGAETKAASVGLYDKMLRPDGYPLPDGYDPVADFGHLIKFAGSRTLLMSNHDYTVEEAEDMLSAGRLDMVSFGRPFIFNPDVVLRIKRGIPLAGNDRDATVFYGSSDRPDEGYNDWPAVEVA